MKIVSFENGVRALVVPVEGMRSVSVEVQVKIGAKYEKKKEAGLSHFLEHMAFKGTEKRKGAAEIFQEIDAKGAGFEAETGYESTSYGITTTAENREWAVEILSDILFNSRYPEEELIKEKGVIGQEIKMYQDNPMMGLASEAVKWLWGESNIGCWNISGELKEIEKVERDELVEFRRNLFSCRETVVVMAGRVTEADLEVVEENFGGVMIEGEKLPQVKIKWTEEKNKIIKRPVKQGHLGIIVPTFGILDKRKYAMRLLNIILAGNASSRLFEEIRSKRGWAYYVYPIGETLNEDGFWGVQAGVPIDKVTVTKDLIEKEIMEVGNSLSEEELKRAKSYLRGKIELLMDKSEFWAGYVGNKVLMEGKVSEPEEELKKIEEVRWNEVKDLAKDIFKPDRIKNLVISE
jgi:predicted Zn-dependent peptidase